MKCAMKRWKNVSNEDRMLKGILSIRSLYEVDFSHWVGAHRSVHMKRQLNDSGHSGPTDGPTGNETESTDSTGSTCVSHTGGYHAYNYDEAIEEAYAEDEVGYTVGDPIKSIYTPGDVLIPVREELPWELLKPPNKIILALTIPQPGIYVAPLGLHMGFRGWVAAYRMRRKTKMKIALPIAKYTILQRLYTSIFNKL